MRKFFFYLLIFLLATASAFVLGLLSFSGMFAIAPILFVAVAAFALAVVYEWEIYSKNIRAALNKLFNKPWLIENKLAKDFLIQHFPSKKSNVPQFFQDYQQQLLILHQLSHKKLTQKERLQKKQLEKRIKIMEKWFARLLFDKAPPLEDENKYTKEVREWLKTRRKKPTMAYRRKLKSLQRSVTAARIFSVGAGFFMGVGTTYLLVDAIGAFTFMTLAFSFWPIFIIPLAIIAGIAYGLLTSNALEDMIVNQTIQNWAKKIYHEFKHPFSIRFVLLTLVSILVIGLAIALTICTAGTWWTIAKNSQPIFSFMTKIPTAIMVTGNFIFIGLSSLVFSIENMYTTIEMIEEAIQLSFKGLVSLFTNQYQRLRQRDNWWQLLNPFRILIIVLEVPLRIILFLGHVTSISLTADRPPLIPEFIGFILGIAIGGGVELLVDGHYFAESPENDHEHDHGHNHNHEHDHSSNDLNFKSILKEHGHHHHGHEHGHDLPALLIGVFLTPLYLLATLWDYSLKTEDKPRQSWTHSWKIQKGQSLQEFEQASSDEEQQDLSSVSNNPSSEWQQQQAIYRINRFQEKRPVVLWTSKLFQQKEEATDQLKKEINQKLEADSVIDIETTVAAFSNANPKYAKHRFLPIGSTSTEKLLNTLREDALNYN